MTGPEKLTCEEIMSRSKKNLTVTLKLIDNISYAVKASN
jgi:hypothetical protein